MTRFFRRGDELERELRSARPAPSERLVHRIEASVRATPSPRRGSWRLALPLAFTAVLVAALASVGGMSYAASSVVQAARTVSHVFMRAQAHEAVVLRSLSSGSDQYRPGYGWGDKNHIHTGPPGLHYGKDATKRLRRLEIVKTSFTIDEQAHLWISVVTARRLTATEFKIVQKYSTIGRGANGKAAKNVQYLVLVPRKIPLKLAIPRNLLTAGQRYFIRIIAISPTGARKTLYIPFKA